MKRNQTINYIVAVHYVDGTPNIVYFGPFSNQVKADIFIAENTEDLIEKYGHDVKCYVRKLNQPK